MLGSERIIESDPQILGAIFAALLVFNPNSLCVDKSMHVCVGRKELGVDQHLSFWKMLFCRNGKCCFCFLCIKMLTF